MSNYSAGGRNEAYGSVTRVVIGSSTPETAQQQRVSPWSTTTSSVQKQSSDYLTLPPRRQRANAQPRPTTTATTGSENYWATTSTRQHDLAVTSDATQTQQHRSFPRRRREDFDEQRRAAPASASTTSHHFSTTRQQINAVFITVVYFPIQYCEQVSPFFHTFFFFFVSFIIPLFCGSFAVIPAKRLNIVKSLIAGRNPSGLKFWRIFGQNLDLKL